MGIEEIRKRKMREISDAGNDNLAREFEEQQGLLNQMQQQISAIEAIAKQFMSKEAISRYGALKIAHPETAVKAIAFIAQAVQLGQIKEKIKDEDFKMILTEIKEGKIKFTLKK